MIYAHTTYQTSANDKTETHWKAKLTTVLAKED